MSIFRFARFGAMVLLVYSLAAATVAQASTVQLEPYWKTEWSFSSYSVGASLIGFSNEPSAVLAQENHPNTGNQCGKATADPSSGWYCPGSANCINFGEYYHQKRDYHFWKKLNYPTCTTLHDEGMYVYQDRSIGCPPQTIWNVAAQMCLRTEGEPNPTKNCSDCSSTPSGQGPTVGNPIHARTGDKMQRETDYASPASPLLRFERYYSSNTTIEPTRLGGQWRHTFSRRLDIAEMVVSGVATLKGAWALRPNGNRFVFVLNSSGGFDHDSDVSMTLVRVVDGSGNTTGWRLTTEDDNVEVYSATGQLTSIEDKLGTALTLSYLDGDLSQVVDRQGRTLSFAYTDLSNGSGATRLTALTLPDGQVISYAYNSNSFLARVTWPDGTPSTLSDNPHRDYVYGEGTYGTSSLLTGLIDENANRYASWRYDSNHRAELSVHGTDSSYIDRVEVAYSSPSYSMVKEYSNSSSYVTRRMDWQIINGVVKLTALDQPAGGGGAHTLTYDGDGNRDIVTDFRGTVTDFDHNSRNLETQRIEAKSTTGNASPAEKRTIQTDWNTAFRVPTERRVYNSSSALEAKTTWTYNSRGQVATRTMIDPANTSNTRVTTYTYCESGDVSASNSTCPILGLLKSVDGPRTDVNDVTTYAYFGSTDESGCANTTGECHRIGDLHTVTNALGQVSTTLRYDRAGRVTRTQDMNGVVTDMEYSPRGWLTARKLRGADNNSETDDAITRMQYDAIGQVTRVTQPDGVYIDYTYDGAHRLTDVIDAGGNRIHYTLDGMGRRLTEDTKDPNGTITRTLSRVYDTLGQLQQSKNAAGVAMQTNTYDANQNLDTATDALGHVSDNDYDPLNRLKLQIQDQGAGKINASTGYLYDARDNLRQVTDPKGLNTVYTYDGLNNLTALSSPDTGTTGYTYDAAGNRLTQTDARGVTTTYTYDALNRVMGVSYPTSGLNTTYAYDTPPAICGSAESFSTGRLATTTDVSGSTTFCYDRFGNLTRKVQTTGQTIRATQSTYDLANRVLTQTKASGANARNTLVVKYARDEVGHINAVRYWQCIPDEHGGCQNGSSSSSVVGVNAPPDDSDYTDVVSQADYLPFGPLKQISFPNGGPLVKNYDTNYWIDSIDGTSGTDGGLSLQFSHDALGNIVSAGPDLGGSPSENYHYDGLYRLTGASAAADDANIETYSYDPTGNRTSKLVADATTATAYTYGSTSHRLTAVGSASRSYDADGNTRTTGNGLTNTFDQRNRLVTVANGSTTLMSNQYNGRGERVAKGGTVFTYDQNGRLINEITPEGEPATETDIVWMDDTPVAIFRDGTLYFIQSDHLNTPRKLIDSTGKHVVWDWPFLGNMFGEVAPNEDPDSDAAQVTFNLRYPGQYFDSESGMNYNYFRDYEPGTGRYLESDRDGLGDGPSTYNYAGENSLRNFDSYGLAQASGFGDLGDQVEQALVDAREKVKNCKLGECYPGLEPYFVNEKDRTEILNNLLTMKVVFDPTLDVCGKAPKETPGTIHLGPKAFSQKACCQLASTLAHEANHTNRNYDAGGRGWTEERSDYLELKCFGCEGPWAKKK